MTKRFETLIGRLLQRRVRRGWELLADTADELALHDLKRYRGMARRLERPLGRFIHKADRRLAQPVSGTGAIQTPIGTDWNWRPELWRGPITPRGQATVASGMALGGQVTVFHDCRIPELTCRQISNTGKFDLAPFGLCMDVFRFDGSFLSLSIALPAEAITGLGKRHVLRMDAIIETERPLDIFMRLNIRHGPNTERVVRAMPPPEHEQVTEFDLAYTELNEKRIETAWVDVILEEPELNRIILRDITFSRRPRAGL